MLNKINSLPVKQQRKITRLTVILILISFLIISLVAFNVPDAKGASYVEGVALKSPTNVYEKESRNSKVLKSYKTGTILKYTPSGTEWHSATVYINGKATSGYIYSGDVETSTISSDVLKGIALKSPTNVYQSASTSSKSLKSYSRGHILLYRIFTKDWYIASVYVNGKKRTGYISKADVETAFNQQEPLKGVASKSPTSVYKKGTIGSAWKSYPAGSILQYKTFSPNWYEANVYVKGKKRTGYIHRSHVENIVSKQESISGIGLKSPTVVYSRASTDSTSLKTYPAGRKLIYKTFTSKWYEATVYVNGRARTGYIHVDHVEKLLNSSSEIDGRTLAGTNIYNLASKSAKVVTSISKGQPVKVRPYTEKWFQTTNGFIPASDVTTKDVIKTTAYNYTFSSLVDKQMNVSPKSDGAGKIGATREQVEYYANPSNFPNGTSGFYQFLDLRSSAGLTATEINKKILAGKGILEGQGQAFVDASAIAGLNEVYLLAHTLHETGNGKSVLANGIPVDKNGKVTKDSKGNIANTAATIGKVYNMYGYGAKDSCPIDCGAQYAFDKGWFSPADAIKGGATEVGKNYINAGQDTLYKMRWNPAKTGSHQYATHVKWAEIQANKMADFYEKLDHFVLEFEVPKFLNQPGKTSRPADPTSNKGTSGGTSASITNYPQKVVGKSTANVNLREEPSTSKPTIVTVPKDSHMEILGSNGTWFKVKVASKEGWIHGNYVKVLNLLETKTNLNIRPEPSTSKAMIGSAGSGTHLAAVLDKDSKMVRKNEWYQIYYKTGTAWVSGGPGGTEYIIVK
ncbi:SH3 domain-containing protein [Siminovitchia sediminis]|uniref:SH3 domain-containing protein n=1 Tax=Siminovitchia sediminis TaxID=1274353 RepID=A0ABW4KK05_9BACI